MKGDQGSGIRDQGSGIGDQGSGAPPRIADWILRRVLPLGKRGESILGDLHEEFSLIPDRRSLVPGLIPTRALWYWQQTLRLVLRYAASRSPQQPLSYPRSRPMFELTSDIKTAFRGFARAPGTSLLIVFTLAFAIAAATIGFSVADLALFRGLPVDDNARVVSVFVSDTHGSNPRARVSAPDLIDYRARTTTLEQLSGMRDGRAALIRNGQSQTLAVTYATANLFASMGQAPLVGRVFAAGEDAPGAAPVAVLSHHFWRDEMHSRPDAIGQTLPRPPPGRARGPTPAGSEGAAARSIPTGGWAPRETRDRPGARLDRSCGARRNSGRILDLCTRTAPVGRVGNPGTGTARSPPPDIRTSGSRETPVQRNAAVPVRRANAPPARGTSRSGRAPVGARHPDLVDAVDRWLTHSPRHTPAQGSCRA